VQSGQIVKPGAPAVAATNTLQRAVPQAC